MRSLMRILGWVPAKEAECLEFGFKVAMSFLAGAEAEADFYRKELEELQERVADDLVSPKPGWCS